MKYLKIISILLHKHIQYQSPIKLPYNVIFKGLDVIVHVTESLCINNTDNRP